MDCTPMGVDETLLSVKLGNNKSKKNIFDRRLISQVRRCQFLYDRRHKFFSDAAKEVVAWQVISKKLKSSADTCKSRWMELLYKYQYYVYRLRNNFISNQKENNGGPLSMALDSELILLFKFMDDPKYFPIPSDIVEAVHKEEQQRSSNVDEDLILMEEPVELIVINEDDDDSSMNSDREFKVTKEMKTLVEQVIKYPQLYDSALAGYFDYARKSFLWNVIATAIGDKATKLMKCWILMVTRYEWEISRTPPKNSGATHQTELHKLMMVFEPYVLANPDSVYKQSFYLKQQWHQPLDQLKDVLNLIYRMKKLPHVVYITDSLLKEPMKNANFFRIWDEVAKMKGSSAAECESTWLTMRLFYWELVKMRQHNYQLADKWYFETFISELYELSGKSKMVQQPQMRKPHRKQRAKALERTVKCLKTALRNAAENTNVNDYKMTKIKLTKSRNVAPVGPRVIQLQTQLEQPPLPKITSAISLAKPLSMSVKGDLVIRPICPHNHKEISPASSSIELPLSLPHQANVSTIIMASAAGANTPCPPLVFFNARSIGCPTVSDSNITISTTMSSNVLGAASPPSSITPLATTSPPVDLPKISSAKSLFNSDEISIELKHSLKGNYLFIEHPPLSEKYRLLMPTTVKFIREVLGIPRLHSTQHSEAATLINGYWERIGKRFNMPSYICQACWNFLKDCFSEIAPMKDLMKPFSAVHGVWTHSDDLFALFDQHAVSNGWLEYRRSLPEVVELIGKYPILYNDVVESVNETNTDIEVVWCFISYTFPNINNISTIWTSLKNVFCQYMSDLERGIENKWHIHWWRVLSRLNFLVEARYSLKEPYYYIVSSRMMIEIKRCALIET